jgi:uncharacterized repeat protein (TIGR01451 family)
MSSIARHWLIAVAALAIAVSPAVASSTAAAAPVQHAADPTLTIRTSGDRLTSVAGNTSATGGMVTGVEDVTYRVTGNGVNRTCTSDTDGNCVFTNIADGTYTVTQESAPTGNTPVWDNYFLSPVLGVGQVTATASDITTTPYDSFSVTVNGNTTFFPAASTASSSSNTVRSGQWAVSRYNPSPPVRCSRSVALLFDLSESITAADLNRYKTSAKGFVRALLGTGTKVTLYTFGTSAPAPGGGNATFGPESTTDVNGVRDLERAIDGLTRPSTQGFSAQYTNWDAGIWQIARNTVHYDEALVLTDGDPTVYGAAANGAPDNTIPARTRLRNVENGIFAANALKDKGTRIVAVGLADRDNPGSVANLKAISGPVRGSDYFLIPFDALESVLEDLAVKDCATLSITKEGHPTTYHHVGQVITYTYTVKNTSPSDGFTLHNITVHDDLLGVITDCRERTLAPGQSTTCTATHRITQDDLNAGHVINTAYSTGNTPNGTGVTSDKDEEIVTARQYAAIKVTKEATPQTYSVPDQSITFHYTVRNTGNVRLTGVTLTDDRATGISCTPSTPATLNPGDVMRCTGATTTTQEDVNAGSIPNTATATGNPPNRRPVTGKADEKVFAERSASIELTKRHAPRAFSRAGQTIRYTYAIRNTGNVPLENLRLTDDKIPGPFTCTPVALGGTLAPGEVTRCTASYTTTQADVDAGLIKNTAATTGTPPDGMKPPEDEASNEVPGRGRPGIVVTKDASPQTYTKPGQTITYTYVMTNIGTLTLRNVQLTDTKIPGPFTCTPVDIGGVLPPHQSTTCTATHVTTQADVDAGSIVNAATAEGTPPTGPPTVSPPAEEVVTAKLTSAIEISKTATPQTYDRLGQRITYKYVITNTGNVTLDNVTVADDRITALTCTPPEGSALAPGAVMRCSATHVTTQADVDAGSIPNTATATGRPPTGPEVSDKADEQVTAGPGPAIDITKTASPKVFTKHGQVITYKYLVTNTGNVTLHNVTVTDTRYGRITCPRTTLAPGASMTCHTTHAITAVDMDEGSIFNSSVATGHPPIGGPVESEPSHALVTGKVVVTPEEPELPEVPVTG